MDQVKLYDEDFKILDRYRGYLEIVREYGLMDRSAFILLHQLFKEKELEMFKNNDGNYIVNILRRHVMNKYLNNEK
jgi:hypothetical protein